MAQLAQSILKDVRGTRSGVALWKADDLSLIEVAGPDARAFLHNMLTADVKKLKVGEGAFSLKTSPRGMPEAALHMYRTADDTFLLITSADNAADALQALEKLHITEDLSLKGVSHERALISIQGKNAHALVSSLCDVDIAALQPHGVTAAKLASKDVLLLKQSLTGDEGYLVACALEERDALFDSLRTAGEKLGVVEPDQQAREVMRVEAGLPLFGREILPNAVASELGIHHEAFSYDKGCFIGQEIVARIRTKGEVPFLIRGLSFPENADVPEPGTKLDADDGTKGVAIVTSSTFSPLLGCPIAIARVKRGYQMVGVKLAGGGEVVELPFSRPSTEDARSKLYDDALSLFARDEEEKALELLKQELRDNADNLDAMEATAVIHDRAGRTQEAIDWMKKVADAQPKHLMANVNLSIYYMKLGDKATAEDYQAKATRISMEQRVAEARARGETPSADDQAQQIAKLEARVEKFKAIIEMDPGDVLGHFGAGKAYLDLKRYRNAAEHFAKVVEIQPDYSVAWANLGTAYAALGETDNACETFEKGIEIAGEKGDLMPKRDMEHRLAKLKGE